MKKNDFIHVNSTVAGKYNKHKQDGGHLGFPIRMILATADLKVTSILPMNFESITLSVPEKKFKINFQDGRHGRNWDFLSGRFELFLIYQSPRCFLLRFESNGLLLQKKKRKIDFQDGRHLGFAIGTILAIFDLQVIQNGPLVQENTWKKSFEMAAMIAILDFRSNNLS